MRTTILICLLAGTLSWPLKAAKLAAGEFNGAGNYEYLFFSAGRQAEAQELTRRIAELAEEEKRLAADLTKAEAELAAVEGGEEKKKTTRLEWSAIENVTGYSVRLYDKEKNLIGTHSTDKNFLVLELEPGDYQFQVAAVTKYKTGVYSRLARLKVGKGKPSEQRLKAEEALEALREKLLIIKKFHSSHATTLRQLALRREAVTTAPAELTPPSEATSYIVIRQDDAPRYSQVFVLPERPVIQSSRAVVAEAAQSTSNFLWGAGLFAGVQDTRLDFFRVTLGAEAFLRYDKPLLRFFYPQLKFASGVSPGKERAFDGMVHSLLNAGAYYPIEIARSLRLLVSVSTGPNVFFVLGPPASATALQWGVMPSIELQYQMWERTSIYVASGINFTFDPKGVLRFFPISAGLTRHF